MVDEPENHTLALLREIRAEMRERFEEMRERFEKVDADAAATKGEVLKLRADVAEGTAVVKDVAVRLTLIEKRLNAMERV
jgi:predicted phage gp36 major capsid-like protein